MGSLVDEAALIESAQQGDRDALRQIYELNVDAVLGYLVNRVGRDAAEDLTADVFVKAFSTISRFRWTGAPLRAWLLRVAHNVMVNHLRRARTRTDYLARRGPEHVAAAVDRDGGLGRAEASDVLACLDLLPSAHREVLELRFVHDLNVAETASVLGSNAEAVRALTYRALKGLRSVYEGERGGAGR